MSEPNEYLAIRTLRDNFAAISTARGFYYDVLPTAVSIDPVAQWESMLRPDGPRPVILIERGEESWSFSAGDQVEKGGVRLSMPLTVHHIVERVPEADDDRMQLHYRGCADIERAVALDPSLGGTIFETLITKRSIDYERSGGTRVWSLIDLTLDCFRDYGHPNAGETT